MSKQSSIDEVIDEILDFATLDHEALELAKSRWSKLDRIRQSSFKKEKQSGKYSNQVMTDMFDGTIRLIDECEKLSHHASYPRNSRGGSPNITFVVDADLFGNFAQIDASPTVCLRGFNFLSDKILSASKYDTENHLDMVERNYFVALLSELFSTDFPIAITDTGVSELSNLPSRFLRSTEDKSKTGYQLERLRQANRHAQQLSLNIERANDRINTISKIFQLSEADRAARASEAFGQIANSIAIPSSINNYVLARLNYALRSTRNNLGRVATVVATSLRKGGAEVDAADFEFVCRQIDLYYRPQVNAARRAMEKSYTAYLGKYMGVKELGYGQIENVSALFEIHLINCILDKLEIDHTARYIHKNVSVFGFLRGFPRGRVAVPSLHPRFTFFFARPEILTKKVKSGRDSFLPAEHLEVVTTLVSSFETRIFSDGKITSEEYEIFSRTTQEMLTQIQETHCSLLIAANEFEEEPEIRRIQSRAAHAGLVEYFDEILNKCAQYQSEWSDKKRTDLDSINDVRLEVQKCMKNLDQIGEQLEDSLLITKVSLADQIQEARTYKKNSAYSRTSILHMDECVEALNTITAGNTKSSASQVLLSAYRNEPDGRPLRVTVIPLSGGYRYLFSLLSKRLAKHLSNELPEGSAPTQEFCDEVISFVNRSLPSRVVTTENVILLSCKYLVSSFQSASLRNWNLSLKLVETAIGYLDDALGTAKGQDASDLSAQKAECVAVQQVAMRALSEETHSKSRKRDYLLGALSKLECGLKNLSQVNDSTYQERTPILIQSVRFFTGRVALELEKDINIFRGFFPKDISFSWASWGDIRSEKLPNIEETLFQDIVSQESKSPTRKKYKAMTGICEQMLKDTLQITANVKNGKMGGHADYMWEFACLRIAQVLDFVRLVEFIRWDLKTKRFIDPKLYSHARFPELNAMTRNLAIRDKQNHTGPKGSPEQVYDDWGLLAATKFYFNVCGELSADPSAIPNLASSSSWTNLQSACSRLVQTGLPRYVVNELKDGIKEEIQLRSEISLSEADLDN